MNLKKKKELAAKTLGVGKHRIIFNQSGLPEIKEAITKQDIKSLLDEGIIAIKPIKGRRKVQKRKRKRGPGKIKMKVKHRKQDYVKITRKLRKHLRALKTENSIEKELYYDLRKKIKMRTFKNLSQLKEYIENLKILEAKLKESKTVKKEKSTKTKGEKSRWN